MKNQPALWYSQPSLKVVLIFVSIWLIGNGLLIVAITDIFRQPFLVTGHYISVLMIVMSTFQTGKLIRNYFCDRTTRNQLPVTSNL
ncbi:MAG: hypothetical protein KF856_15290 [Cyclobacteriaceae bacterium]|nr:hypothetical protein [Cyclobacteriaceae bacterium]